MLAVRKSASVCGVASLLLALAACSGVANDAIQEQDVDEGHEAPGGEVAATDDGLTPGGGGETVETVEDVEEIEGIDDSNGAPGDDGDAGLAPPGKSKALVIWHWNVAGHAIHRGSTTTGLIEALTSSIRNRKADFVSLNELCFDQYQAIQRTLSNAGWPKDPKNFSRFAESRPAGKSTCKGKAYGNAIFSKMPLGGAQRLVLPSDGSAEHRNMLCAPTTELPHLRFCTTHITTSSAPAADGVAHNSRQLSAVLSRLEAYHAAGDTVVIAGDFNAQPHYARMDRFYSSKLVSPYNGNNKGHYRELDDADPKNCIGYGEGTDASEPKGGACGKGKKIDLIFVRENKLVGSYDADALAISNACSGPCSDHNILIGSARVAVKGL